MENPPISKFAWERKLHLNGTRSDCSCLNCRRLIASVIAIAAQAVSIRKAQV